MEKVELLVGSGDRVLLSSPASLYNTSVHPVDRVRYQYIIFSIISPIFYVSSQLVLDLLRLSHCDLYLCIVRIFLACGCPHV